MVKIDLLTFTFGLIYDENTTNDILEREHLLINTIDFGQISLTLTFAISKW